MKPHHTHTDKLRKNCRETFGKGKGYLQNRKRLNILHENLEIGICMPNIMRNNYFEIYKCYIISLQNYFMKHVVANFLCKKYIAAYHLPPSLPYPPQRLFLHFLSRANICIFPLFWRRGGGCCCMPAD